MGSIDIWQWWGEFNVHWRVYQNLGVSWRGLDWVPGVLCRIAIIKKSGSFYLIVSDKSLVPLVGF